MNKTFMPSSASVSYTDVLADITALGSDKMKLGVERIRLVLAALGSPQNAFKKIHVVGTNGKGSTCRILSTMYQAAGYRVGLFTSPDLTDVRERIQIDNALIAQDAFARLGHQVLTCIQAQKTSLSYFEALTVIGFLAFAEAKVDIAIVEAGLGGRLDSTNVFDTPQSYPEAVIVTPISLDHIDLLGPTVADIAREKVAVFQPNCPAIIAPQSQDEAILEVIQDRARLQTAPLTWVNASGWQPGKLDTTTGRREVIVPQAISALPLPCKLLGGYQVQNMATAVTCVQALQDVLPVTSEAVLTGLQEAEWPGRVQWLPQQRLLLDGSHNPQGLQALAEMIQADLAPTSLNLALSLLTTKPLEALLPLLSAHSWLSITVLDLSQGSTRRHLPFYAPEVLRDWLVSQGISPEIIWVKTLSDWLSSLESTNSMHHNAGGPLTIATGSLYTAGEILTRL